MNSRLRSGGVLLGALAMGVGALAGAAPATGAGVAATVETYEDFDFVPGPGGGLVLDWGYAPRTARVPSGATIRWRDGVGSGEFHTATVVDAANVPKTIDEVFNCQVCNEALAAHDPGNDGRPPFLNRVNVGANGFDRQGDSLLIRPRSSAYAMVSARSGKTLNYVCAIHPWMQAKIRVG